ncbi:MAG: peptidoglycan recognition family protein [Phycisphaerales bacterium]|jgi:hypothetical protein|nr:peptidoglycan recognition family protein [Phycisphaerales bacterium]
MAQSNLDNSNIDGSRASSSRRTFMLASALFLVGCGTKKVTTSLPSPVWSSSKPTLELPVHGVVLPEPAITFGAISRNTWAKGSPVSKNMNRMLPAKYITVHHDGMTSFTTTSKSSAASRLETIRRSHLRRDGGRWGDIGYHFAIDPAGRLWQARPLNWQGAHVKARNEGNIGIVVLGNYELQSVNRSQTGALTSTLKSLMKKYKIPVSKVRTHQEWAATACPGKSLQKVMVGIRGTSLKNV